MRVSVIQFPGTNCAHDVLHTYSNLLNFECELIWHKSRDLKNPDLVVIPGGFSYGDYLRTGSLAKLSPVMEEVAAFARKGGLVLGICNGFQILCEAGLLPGVLLKNIGRKFISRFLTVKCEHVHTKLTKHVETDDLIVMPVAHFEGNYFADEQTLEEIEGNGQVVLRYCSSDGFIDHDSRLSNPNGSAQSIAGICNYERNVLGMMPHPERVSESLMGPEGIAKCLDFLRL